MLARMDDPGLRSTDPRFIADAEVRANGGEIIHHGPLRIVFARDRLVKALLGDVGRDGQAGCDGFVEKTQRCIKAAQQGGVAELDVGQVPGRGPGMVGFGSVVYGATKGATPFPAGVNTPSVPVRSNAPSG